MTNTTKYILIGGAALVGVVIIGSKIAAQRAAESQPTGIGDAISAGVDLLKQLGDKATTVSYAAPTLPSDATATPKPKTDAMGYRQVNAFVPRAQTLTAGERALVGLR